MINIISHKFCTKEVAANNIMKFIFKKFPSCAIIPLFFKAEGFFLLLLMRNEKTFFPTFSSCHFKAEHLEVFYVLILFLSILCTKPALRLGIMLSIVNISPLNLNCHKTEQWRRL